MGIWGKIGNALGAPLRAPGMSAITKPINAGLSKTPGLRSIPGALGMGGNDQQPTEGSSQMQTVGGGEGDMNAMGMAGAAAQGGMGMAGRGIPAGAMGQMGKMGQLFGAFGMGPSSGAYQKMMQKMQQSGNMGINPQAGLPYGGGWGQSHVLPYPQYGGDYGGRRPMMPDQPGMNRDTGGGEGMPMQPGMPPAAYDGYPRGGGGIGPSRRMRGRMGYGGNMNRNAIYG